LCGSAVMGEEAEAIATLSDELLFFLCLLFFYCTLRCLTCMSRYIFI
jgi:hypothetical protein